MIATVPCPRRKPGCAPSAAEHCFPAGESRKGVSYGVQQHFCLSHGHGHGVLRADLPDRADLSHERRGGPREKGRPGTGPGCAHYELDGQQTDEFPFPVCLQDAKPVIEYVDGWKCDISKVRNWDELPENARNYVEYVERAIGCHIGYVSVGAERDSLIIR